MYNVSHNSYVTDVHCTMYWYIIQCQCCACKACVNEARSPILIFYVGVLGRTGIACELGQPYILVHQHNSTAMSSASSYSSNMGPIELAIERYSCLEPTSFGLEYNPIQLKACNSRLCRALEFIVSLKTTATGRRLWGRGYFLQFLQPSYKSKGNLIGFYHSFHTSYKKCFN